MLAATFKFIDRQNPLYQFLSANLLPAALILLLLSSDVKKHPAPGTAGIDNDACRKPGDHDRDTVGIRFNETLGRQTNVVGFWGIIGFLDRRQRQYDRGQRSYRHPGSGIYADGSGGHNRALRLDGDTHRRGRAIKSVSTPGTGQTAACSMN